LAACGLAVWLKAWPRQNNTVADRAYSWRTGDDCLVYIEESGGFEPYIVLTANYGGNALLLRKYLLPDLMPFNENEKHLWGSNEYGGYYEDSTIDKYLNNEFIGTLSQTMQDAIVNSDVVITDKNTWILHKNRTKTISRKVFLLSLMELSGPDLSTRVPEGNTLTYFAGKYTRKVTYLSDGERCAYWTRTPEIWEIYNVFLIGHDKLGAEGADVSLGVRPAFCLKKSTEITKRTDIVNGQTVYVVE
ncbi:MAG: DUF6273 domain-containing protein, partial [Firmicutes bacterium]|nr:DUF6273 domain-containing protein [Bacillota bacterium]